MEPTDNTANTREAASEANSLSGYANELDDSTDPWNKLHPYSEFDEVSLAQDAYGYANSLFSLQPNYMVRGSLSEDDVDYYELTIPEGGLYQLTISNKASLSKDWNTARLEVVVLNDTLATITRLDASDRTSTYVIYTSSQTDLPQIKITGNAGKYSVALEKLTPYSDPNLIADDFADDFDTATTALQIGQSLTGAIEHSFDSDWFKIELEAGKTYQFALSGALSGGGTLAPWNGEPIIAIFDPGVVYQSSATGNSWLEPVFTFSPPTSKTYYVEVTDPLSQGSYTLSVSEAAMADDYLNTSTTTGMLSIKGATVGNLENIGDEDWFKVSLEAGKTYTFQLSGGEAGLGTLGLGANGLMANESLLMLYGPNPGLPYQASATAGGVYGEALLTFAPTTTGDYYLEVSSLHGTGKGTYLLQAATEKASPPDGLVIIQGDAHPGEILLADTGSLSDENGLGPIHFQWLKDGVAIAGATYNNYALQQADVNHIIAARVDYVDGAGFHETLFSNSRLPTTPLNEAYTDLIELYAVILDRAPDKNGLKFWSGLVENGMSLEQVAEEMWVSPGGQAKYRNIVSDESKVGFIYHNLLARDADKDGLQFWLEHWQNDDIGPVGTMLAMIDALTTSNSTDPQAIEDRLLFQAKVDIGGYLATSVGSNNIALADYVYYYLGNGHSVSEAQQYIDQHPSVIGQAKIADDGML